MTIEQKVVFLRDCWGWSFQKIADALELNSRQHAHQMYKKERPRFDLAEILEILKD